MSFISIYKFIWPVVETILVLLPHMLCNALVACGRLLGVEQQTIRPVWESHNFPHTGRIVCCSTPNSRPPATKALHTKCGNNTSIVSSSWWWACEWPKHVEQIIIAIHHSVAPMWFSFLRLYYNAWTNIHQIYHCLTHKPLIWRIWWAPNIASRWQMGFNSAFKWWSLCYECISLCDGSEIYTTDGRTPCPSQSITGKTVERSASMAALKYRSVIDW